MGGDNRDNIDESAPIDNKNMGVTNSNEAQQPSNK